MKLIQRMLVLIAGFAFVFSAQVVNAQCGKFADTPEEEAAKTAHVLYRDQFKLEKFDEAYGDWKKAYELAPAADGRRASHYQDGRVILLHKMKSAEGTEKEKLYATIMRLFDEEMTCYGQDDESAALINAYKAFDMFYDLESPYAEVEKVLKASMETAGDKTEYFIFLPYAYVVVDLFKEGKMDKTAARGVYSRLNEIADLKVKAGGESAADYEQAKKDVYDVFVSIEEEIFDCDYFKERLVPEYQAAPDDTEVLQRVFNRLVQKGCDQNLPIMQEMKGKYAKIISAKNAAEKEEYERNNPAVLARKMYDAGDYQGALAKYEEALGTTSDPEKQANIFLGMASIHGRHLGSPSKGRQMALKAAGMKSGWGKPYMLIGDLYAKSARSCGDSFNQRLAILAATDKYAYAKSIDPSVASEASSRINTYRASRPDKETAFMMGYKEGSKVKVGCWIGESVTLKF